MTLLRVLCLRQVEGINTRFPHRLLVYKFDIELRSFRWSALCNNNQINIQYFTRDKTT